MKSDNCQSMESILFLVSMMTFLPVVSSLRYIRQSELANANGTENMLLPLYQNDSIEEFLNLCMGPSKIPCPYENVTNVTLMMIHVKYLRSAKDKVRYTMDRYRNPITLLITGLLFIICLVLGIYLVMIKHLDWRQFGHEIVSDGSFGFYLRIIKSMQFQVIRISKHEYEKIITDKLTAAMRTEENVVEEHEGEGRRRSTISEDARKKTKILTREELHELENERRKLRVRERQRIENEEALMSLQIKKSEDAIILQKEEYYESLLKKYPLANEPKDDLVL